MTHKKVRTIIHYLQYILFISLNFVLNAVLAHGSAFLLCVSVFVPGELKTAALLDRERTAGYMLIAQATDGGGLFCRSEISLTILDVNDNAPSFAFTRFMASVYESAATKALLTRLQANDPDEGKYFTHAKLRMGVNECLRHFVIDHHIFITCSLTLLSFQHSSPLSFINFYIISVCE